MALPDNVTPYKFSLDFDYLRPPDQSVACSRLRIFCLRPSDAMAPQIVSNSND
jgi:hypothetical protein